VAELIKNIRTDSADNALFGAALQSWLKRNGCQPTWGAVIIALEDDGYSIVALGAVPISGRDLVGMLNRIADEANTVQLED